MSKYDLSWDETKYNRFIREGRGKGVGEGYKPWLTVHDVPSIGIASKHPGWKSNRLHHLLSHNELHCLLIYEWLDSVIDIREQYPMDLNTTLKIAEEAGIKHPVNRESKFPYVMTTDFMITILKDGKEVNVVRTVKPYKELEKRRVIELFEIERCYWQLYNVDWGIVTDKDLPKTLYQNIDWVYSDYRLESTGNLTIEDKILLCEILKDRLENSNGKVAYIARNFDKEQNLEPGTGLSLFKHLVAIKEIKMDMMSSLCTTFTTDSIIEIIYKDKRRYEHDKSV